MRNFVCMLSFRISHIFFQRKKIYVILIDLGVCFFTKRVHVLVKFSKTSMSFVKTLMSSLLFKNFNVFCQDFNVFFTFQDFNVFCQDFNVFFTFQEFKVFCLVLLILHTFILLTGFTALVFASCQPDSKIA